MGRGRSVYKQPETRVDKDRTTQRGGIPSKKEGLRKRGVVKRSAREIGKGNGKGDWQGEWQGEFTRGCAMT
jgi:hypothetical protein